MVESYFNVIITAPDGATEWRGHLQCVPRRGDSLTMRRGVHGDEVFSGYVSEVHWGIKEGQSGASVSVWLTEDVPGVKKDDDDERDIHFGDFHVELEKCSKCGAVSGGDWSQCDGACPMPMSPHFDEIPF